MTDKKSNDSRRKLLKSLVAGSGAVVAGKALPESWTKPVVDSVMLPAHAQTTGTESAAATTYTKTIRVDVPDVGKGGNLLFDPFEFDVTGYTPTGPGTLSIETLGDYDSSDEYFSYLINDASNTDLGDVPTPGTGTECGSTPETGSLPIPLISLQQASAGGTIVITLENSGEVDAFCDTEGEGQYVSITLTFPATIFT